MSYSQENEEGIIKDYFKDFKGTLLSIGENDGVTLSNTRQLILDGWSAVLVEPSRAFKKLHKLYQDNMKVRVFPYAIGTENRIIPFFESGCHLTEADTGLISTMDKSEVRRWKGSKYDNFTEVEVECKTFASFMELNSKDTFDFITVDAEGMDWNIVKQMDLGKLECKLICVEHNAIEERKILFEKHMKKYGLSLLASTYHNLIFALDKPTI